MPAPRSHYKTSCWYRDWPKHVQILDAIMPVYVIRGAVCVRIILRAMLAEAEYRQLARLNYVFADLSVGMVTILQACSATHTHVSMHRWHLHDNNNVGLSSLQYLAHSFLCQRDRHQFTIEYAPQVFIISIPSYNAKYIKYTLHTDAQSILMLSKQPIISSLMGTF